MDSFKRYLKIRGKYFTGLFLLLSIINGMLLFILYNILVSHKIEEFVLTQSEIVSQIESATTEIFKSVESDLLFLANQLEIKELSQFYDQKHKKLLAEEYTIFATHKKIYDQIRFINNNGKEVVRVNFQNNQAGIVPEENLQDKSKRYYFQHAIALAKDNIYTSPFDLNIENTKIEKPLKPMIRFLTPVFGKNKTKLGVVALNYNGNNIIGRLKRLNETSGSIKRLLLNQDGYYLVGFEKEDEWGFMYPTRKSKTMANDSELWPQLIKSKRGVFFSEKAVLVYDTFYPKTQLMSMDINQNAAAGTNTTFSSPKDTFWKIISYIPYDYLLLEKKRFFFYVSIALTLLIGVISLKYSNFKYRLHLASEEEKNHHVEIRKMNNMLDSKNRDLTARNDQLAIANTTKTKFFSIIAHDIKNPLVSLIGFPEIILTRADTFSKEEIIALVLKIKGSADNLREMIENLLDWSHSQLSSYILKPEKFDLVEIINENISLLKPTANAKNISIAAEITGVQYAFADKNAIKTVLRNLLSNSIKFTPKYGNIVFRTNQIIGRVEISISDDGVGVDPEDLPNIFKVDIKTTKKGTEGETGTGLGLPLCYELLHKNHGEMRVESRLNKGSTFYIDLPT